MNYDNSDSNSYQNIQCGGKNENEDGRNYFKNGIDDPIDQILLDGIPLLTF
jgi:hypothetical protein